MFRNKTAAFQGVVVGAAVLCLGGCAQSPGVALRAATATVARTICGETFVSGLDPDQSFRELYTDYPGVRKFSGVMRHNVDRANRSVTVSLAGYYESRSVFHEGYGCDLEFDGIPDRPLREMPKLAADTPDPWNLAGPAVVEPSDPRLKAALDDAFVELKGEPQHGTKAVVVVYNGRIIAERYAPGVGVDTPLHAWSVSKSVTNAFLGILVRQGRLTVDAPAPVAAWSSPSDPRHAITLEDLMRMTSGLDLDETNTGFDQNSRMQYSEPDMASYAEKQTLIAPPGTRWAYSSPGYMILSQIVRDAVGGRAEDVRAFAERELFRPIGMKTVALEFDHAGAPIGSSDFYATARDWARFGLLYANDGVVDGKRILPAGWAAFSSSPTKIAEFGYGAGFWTNLGDAKYARMRVDGGMPADSYFASGSLGQRVVIAPAEHLVIVRFGRSMDFPDFDARGMVRLTEQVNAIVNGAKK